MILLPFPFFSMMNMMYSSTGIGIAWGIHWLFDVLWILGVVFLTAWAIKTMQPASLKLLAFWLLGIGIVGTLLMIPFSMAGWSTMMSGGMMTLGNGILGMPMMMGNDMIQWHENDSGDHDEAEAQGEKLFNDFQSKQTGCSDLMNEDFDAIGDYVMGQHSGNAHKQMDNMMKQMMGEQNTEQMHIIMGRRVTGCFDGDVQPSSPFPYNGMMNGGGTMM